MTAMLAASLLSSLALIAGARVLYAFFLSPLSGIPSAHWTARLSRLWLLWVQWKTDEHAVKMRLHLRLGPVVVIGPNELSVSGIDNGVETIYGGGFERSSFYSEYFHFCGAVPMVAMRPRRLHAQRKRMLWRPYTKSKVQSSPELAQIIDRVIRKKFRDRIHTWSKEGLAVDVLQDCKLLAYEISIYWVFGIELGQGVTEPREKSLANSDAFVNAVPMDTAGYLRYRLCLLWNSLHLPSSLRLFTSPNAARELAEKITWDMCSSTCAEARSKRAPAIRDDKEFTLCRHLLRHFQASGVPEEHQEQLLASELMDHILPAIGSLGLTLMYAMFELSKFPGIQTDLRDELRSALSPGIDGDPGTRPSVVDGLPQLNSIVLETLRLHLPAKTCFPREVPECGAQLGLGIKVPGGVVVSSSAYWSQMDASVYENPEQWRPRRWLTSDQDLLRKMDRSLWPFGRGPTMCIARHLAMRVLKEAITLVYLHYQTNISSHFDEPHIVSHDSRHVSDKVPLVFSTLAAS